MTITLYVQTIPDLSPELLKTTEFYRQPDQRRHTNAAKGKIFGARLRNL
jgi:hypothetical protein